MGIELTFRFNAICCERPQVLDWFMLSFLTGLRAGDTAGGSDVTGILYLSDSERVTYEHTAIKVQPLGP